MGRLKRMSRARPRIVIDTNLIIAAYWNPHSSSSRIIRRCIRGKYKFYYTADIQKEASIILRNIHASKRYCQKIESLFQTGTRVRVDMPLKVIKEDPLDDKFLECALSARADYIVSNDRHLLRIGRYMNTAIIRPADL